MCKLWEYNVPSDARLSRSRAVGFVNANELTVQTYYGQYSRLLD